MGYGTRQTLHSTIRTFWPDDTDTELYFSGEISISDLLARVKEKWPDCDLSDININAEQIQTDCLGHDCYDFSDYTDFIVVTRES